ncbi:MAG: extracellular solute-binding protein [Treponema sp.]|jgi:raffinose/stachyose/melibiose transport system substrate-binding protein|nr:extracellular solute-binding protein [Treponema sp.]
MKKLGITVLCAAMVVTALTGCSKKESAANDGKVKISIWHSFVGSDQRAPFMEKRMAEFIAANPDIIVDEQKMPRDQYQTRLKTAAAAKDLPTGFLQWPDTPTQEFAQAGLLAPINEYLDANPGWKNDLLPQVLDAFTVDGKTYGVGLGISLTSIVFYNKALFDQYNVKVPSTLDELRAAIRTFKANNIIPLAHGDKPLWPAQSSLMSIVGNRYTGSQWLFDVIAGKNNAKFSDPEFISALNLMKELAGAFNEDYNSLDNVQMRDYFYRGEAAMMIDGSWALPGVIENAPEAMKPNIEMTVFPSVPGGKGDPSTISGVSSTSIVISSSATPEQRAALYKLIQFLTNQEAQKMYMDYNIPVASKTIQPDVSLVTPLYAKMVTLIQEHPLVTVYDATLSSQQADIINNGLQAVMLSIQTPAELAADLQKTVR